MNNLILLFLSCLAIVYSQTYKAAVVQMKPNRVSDDLASAVLISNAEVFKTHIITAKQKGANIIVFPENGLTTLEPMDVNQLGHLFFYSVQFKLNDIPCDVASTSKVPLNIISCAAKENGIFVVLNVLERISNDTFYNTDIVFDDNGRIINSYRKKNLQNEKLYTAGNENAVFTINVGGKEVKFGILIGSDILHRSAFDTTSQITNVVYSTSLSSNLPYFNGLSTQMGFAMANDVNLLASSYFSLEKGISGSGIYHYDGTIPEVVSFKESYLIVLDVPITTKTQKEGCKLAKIKNVIGDQEEVSFLKYNPINMNIFTTESITTKELKGVKLCNEGTCCVFNGKFDQDPSGKLELAYYKGSQQKLGINGTDDIFACHIITLCLKNGSCSDKDQIKVSNLEVKAEFKGNSYVLPLTLTKDFLPLQQVNVCKSKESLSISINETLSSALFMGHYIMPSSATTFGVNVICLIGAYLLVLVYYANH